MKSPGESCCGLLEECNSRVRDSPQQKPDVGIKMFAIEVQEDEVCLQRVWCSIKQFALIGLQHFIMLLFDI